MSAQEHGYELGTLDEETLDRDESLVRRTDRSGDERRWMILGGAGTLALMSALVGAIALGGGAEPHHLAASLGSPVRDLAAVAAHASVEQSDDPVEAEPAEPKAKQPRVAHKVAAPVPAAAAAIPAATASAAVVPTAQPTPASAPVAPPVDGKDTGETPFSGLPSLPGVDDGAEEAEPSSAPEEPVDFQHDDNPFVEEDEEDVDEDAADEAAAPEAAAEPESAEPEAAPEPEPAAEPEPEAAAEPEAPAPAPAAAEEAEEPPPPSPATP